MIKSKIAIIACAVLIICMLPLSAFAANDNDIIILYGNDVHCAVEGYTKLSAMRNELKKEYEHVSIVSGGDFIQGNSLGIVSKGECVVNIMNLVGYDAVTLGNHEFDYHIDRLNELAGMMDTKPISCNFQKIGEDEPCFEPYTIVSYGDIDVAYIGITTPTTISVASPVQFKDENGNFIYTFNADSLYDIVQESIDSAEAQGADYIIALSHVGYAEDEIYGDLEDVETLIKNTDGFDVVLDAHSHTVIEGKTITDKGGNDVLLSSTGTKFEYIGKLTIEDGEAETELIKTADYRLTDPVIDAYIEQMYEEYAILGERKVASTEVDLLMKDENGNRLVRNHETNLGDLCADAFRYAVNADIGYINGGGIRADIKAGDITYNDLLNVLPFNNSVVLAQVSGQTIKDMMELTLIYYPGEDGAFPHLSGLTFSVNTSIPSSVVINEYGEFSGVDGQYRVYNLKVYNSETESYEDIDLNATYTLAASNYYLIELGSGMKMLESAKILQNEGLLDAEALEKYITENLGGTVDEEYAEVKSNITFTDGEITDIPDSGENNKEQSLRVFISFIIEVVYALLKYIFALLG